MRQQYHFRSTENGVLIWDVHRLVELAKTLPTSEVSLSDIRELDETFWFELNDDQPTCRRIAQHAKLINDTDLSYPIIMSSDGRVMDGMHRVCKALIEGRDTILAVRFDMDPKHDYVDVSPDDLPY